MAATATSGHYIMAQTTIVMTVVVIGLLLLLKMLLLYVVVSTAFILTCGIKFHCLLYVRGGPVILDVWLIGCSLVSGLSVKRIMEMVLVLVLVLVLVSVLDVCCAADDGDDDDDAYDGIGASRAGSCSSIRSCSSSSNNRVECLLVFLQRRRTRHSSFIAAFGHNEIVSRTRTKKTTINVLKIYFFCHK